MLVLRVILGALWLASVSVFCGESLRQRRSIYLGKQARQISEDRGEVRIQLRQVSEASSEANFGGLI